MCDQRCSQTERERHAEKQTRGEVIHEDLMCRHLKYCTFTPHRSSAPRTTPQFFPSRNSTGRNFRLHVRITTNNPTEGSVFGPQNKQPSSKPPSSSIGPFACCRHLGSSDFLTQHSEASSVVAHNWSTSFRQSPLGLESWLDRCRVVDCVFLHPFHLATCWQGESSMLHVIAACLSLPEPPEVQAAQVLHMHTERNPETTSLHLVWRLSKQMPPTSMWQCSDPRRAPCPRQAAPQLPNHHHETRTRSPVVPDECIKMLLIQSFIKVLCFSPRHCEQSSGFT